MDGVEQRKLRPISSWLCLAYLPQISASKIFSVANAAAADSACVNIYGQGHRILLAQLLARFVAA